MSVRIRMKKMGRTHRPFFRICAMDRHTPRDGRVLEELGTYDPSLSDTDARALLKAERIDYWLSVGAQPSDKVGVLIKKYGTGGTRLDEQKAALDRLAMPKTVPDPGKPASLEKPAEPETPAETPAAAEEAAKPAAAAEEASTETPATESETDSADAKTAEPATKSAEPVTKTAEPATKSAEPATKTEEASG